MLYPGARPGSPRGATGAAGAHACLTSTREGKPCTSNTLSPLPASSTPPALPRLSRRAGFWAIAFSFLVLSAFSTAPSALYGLYAQQEHLAPITLTVVYAVYAAGVTASLLLAGHVSDWYGRRAVLIPAMVVAAAAAVLFIAWQSLTGLLVARVLTGLALGATVATATAYIADLDAGRDGAADAPLGRRRRDRQRRRARARTARGGAARALRAGRA